MPSPHASRAGRAPLPPAASATFPSLTLPLPFIVTGLVSLLIGVALIALRPDVLASYHYNQYVIAITHLFTLGWITSVCVGAMYQLAPVALEVTLYSERMARWHYALHTIGVTGMIWMFWRWNLRGLVLFGFCFAAGVALFLYNMCRTMLRIRRWNTIAAGLASALVWLAIAVSAGLCLAAAKRWNFNPFPPLPQMHAHAHLGVGGFFLILLVSVSYKLIPMFTLGELQNTRRVAASLALLNGGLLGLIPAMLFAHPSRFGFALLMMGGLVMYGVEVRAILRARKRRPLDWAITYFLTALGFLAPVCGLALALSWPALPLTERTGQLENLYGMLVLLGVLTLAILGMLYKIVPFLVWHRAYSETIGRGRVPALSELYSTRLQSLGYWLYLPAIGGLSLSTALGHERGIASSALLLWLSLVPFAFNVASILAHLIRPHSSPAASRSRAHPTGVTP